MQTIESTVLIIRFSSNVVVSNYCRKFPLISEKNRVLIFTIAPAMIGMNTDQLVQNFLVCYNCDFRNKRDYYWLQIIWPKQQLSFATLQSAHSFMDSNEIAYCCGSDSFLRQCVSMQQWWMHCISSGLHTICVPRYMRNIFALNSICLHPSRLNELETSVVKTLSDCALSEKKVNFSS